ncbi:DinB family protein [Rubripirellula amarantea]|uniref:DinB family protein n=1 Tax=Rubripirellula amarantea TaxID=2527999 RepID=A0A5C5WQX3_9BACT|nr:DinB family protein [Rubripirellula amarantea]MDA8743618.1 DinB family protein [Rubripirellula amarantea]TWT52433.1 DinB family protein [Rubripirellula amarantea]
MNQINRSIIEAFLPEFDQEMASTRAILALVPDNILDWKAHETLHSIRWNASHLADTLSWVDVTLNETSFDVAPIDGPAHEVPLLETAAAIVEAFDQNLATAQELFRSATDESLAVEWTLLQAGETLFTVPRSSLIKNLFINHMIHHRAFLIAYLRINGVECPHLYGG